MKVQQYNKTCFFYFKMAWGPHFVLCVVLSICLGTTSAGIMRPYRVPGIKSQSATYKASSHSIVLSLWPPNNETYLERQILYIYFNQINMETKIYIIERWYNPPGMRQFSTKPRLFFRSSQVNAFWIIFLVLPFSYLILPYLHKAVLTTQRRLIYHWSLN